MPNQRKAAPLKIPNVSADVLRNLFAAARRCKALAPWEFMNDGELFAIRDPESDLVGYGCVMGAMGEVLALGVYRGDEGLSFHQTLQENADFDGDISDIFALQNCVMCEFVDREELEPEDLKAMKVLGETFRGPQSYPQFRSLIPGHPPWFINEDEAKLLAFSLECACEYAKRVLENPDFTDHGDPNSIFTFRSEHSGDSLSLIGTFEPLIKSSGKTMPASSDILIDELRIKKILNMKLHRDDVWEIDAFYLGGGIINDRERPYYAKMALAADQKSRFLLGMESVPYSESDVESVQELILSAIEKHGHLPLTVAAKTTKSEVAYVAERLSTKLGFKVERKDRLNIISVIQADLTEQMQRGFPG